MNAFCRLIDVSSCAFIKRDYIKLGYLRLIGYRLLSLLSLDDLILHNESFLPCIDLLYLLVCLLRNDSIMPPCYNHNSYLRLDNSFQCEHLYSRIVTHC